MGTTVKAPEHLPTDVLGDEKHTWLNGEWVYVATTGGAECVLGVALTAGTADLTAAYQPFQTEAQAVAPEYAPTTVNLAGWRATHHAWLTLFPGIVIIQCFLHAVLNAFGEQFRGGCERIWAAYHSPTARQFIAGLGARAPILCWRMLTRIPSAPAIC